LASRTASTVLALCALLLSVTAFAAHDDASAGGEFLNEFCGDCHNATDWAGGVAFDTLSHDNMSEDAGVWEEAVKKLRGRLMPPPGEPQPSQQAIDSQVAWLESRLDAAAGARQRPGNVVLHRLNRTEYQNEIRRLLDLDIDAAALLPKDTKADGFDNVALALRVSPAFLDAYIVAAQEVSARALGANATRPVSTVYRASPGAARYQHLEGLPLGTRGGLLVEHLFPADGEYTFNITQSGNRGGGYISGLDSRQRLVMTLDGRRVFEQRLGGEEDLKALDQLQATADKQVQDRFRNIHLAVPAGPHRIGVAFIARSHAEGNEILEPLDGAGGGSGLPNVTAVEVLGPTKVTGISDTPSRRRVFICKPASAAEESDCAHRIIAQFARRAFRRPVSEAELAAPMKFFEGGRQQGFEFGIQQAVMGILASPKFLYRAEGVPGGAVPGSIHRLSDLELASRLSFFLWSEGPDDALLDAAAAGKLSDPEQLDQQLRRMLADPRAQTLATNFAGQWLTVDEIDAIQPDPTLFPEFDGALRRAFHEEMNRFVGSVFGEDRNVLSLLTADWTFVNERLALHYGIPNVRGDRFRRVQLPDSRRYGILGKGAFLMGMSYANRTSPVRRGSWILEQIVGTPPHAPPPGVEALQENTEGNVPRTVRARLEQHRRAKSCNACHGVIDPLGFALENFDAIGAWRAKDRETATLIDAGDTIHGVKVSGPDELRALLLRRPDQFVQTLTTRLMTFALGRGLEPEDMPTVRAIVRKAAVDDYRFSSIVRGIVNSDAFTMTMVPLPKPAVTAAQAH
jgi:mono/diheme cytochrome c family protein